MKLVLLSVFFIACLCVVVISGTSRFMNTSNRSVDESLRQVSLRLKTPPAHNCFVFQNETDFSRANQGSLPEAQCFRASNDLLLLRVKGERAVFLIPEQGEDLKLEKVNVLVNGLMVGEFWYFKLPKSDELFALYPDKTYVFDDEGRSIEASEHLVGLKTRDQDFVLIDSAGQELKGLPKSFFDALESFEQTEAQFKIFPRP